MLFSCHRSQASIGFVLALFLGACAFDEPEEEMANSTLAVRGGAPATAFPEAVLVDFPDGSGCSGAMITPRVVLTAGHCAVPATQRFVVRAPFGGNQVASGGRAAVLDYPARNPEIVPFGVHDVGLLFVDTPINLASYPKLATWQLAENENVVVVGRVDDGQYSSSMLFRENVKTRDGARRGYRFSYDAENVVQAGDSGGPDFLPNTHVIAAVNSAGGGILARVDLVTNWIERQVAANGGFVSGGGPAQKRDFDKKKDDDKKKRR